MKFPTSVTVFAARQVLTLKKNSPAIMFGAGIFAAGASTVLACKATLNLEETLAKHEENLDRSRYLLKEAPDYSQKEHNKTERIVRVRLTADLLKLYGPAIGVGVLSLGLLTGAHVTLTKRNAALIAAYNAVDLAFKEYRARVRDELGEEKDLHFRFGSADKEIVEEGENGHEVKTVKRAKGAGPHSAYARVFDPNNDCWSQSPINNRSFLQAQQNYANDLLQARGHVMLNDVYDLLKMERSVAGTVVGWVKGHGDDFIDFGLFRKDDPIMREFMELEHNDGIVLDFNVDGVVNDLLKRKY